MYYYLFRYPLFIGGVIMGRKKLTERERFYIEKALKNKIPVAQIAVDLNCSRQTVYNEIKRGQVLQTDGIKDFYVYAYDVGQRIHDEASRNKGRTPKLQQDDEYLEQISYWIKKMKYSPQAARYKVGNKLCIKSIYNYVYSGKLQSVSVYDLPYARPKKKKKSAVAKRKYSRGKSIEQRPEYINNRDVYGHWEMDTVYSSKDDLHCLLVLTERMTRDEKVIRMKDRTMNSTIKALDSLERSMGTPSFRNTFKTITCDNGVEFSDFESIERSCRTKGKRTEVYYCHPYSSYERGSNENLNRMIRRWIPKGDDIGLYSPADIRFIEDWINDYPRPMFNGMSSREYCVSVSS